LIELGSGAGDEIFHGGGDQHFTGSGLSRDPRADVDREAGDLFADEFALASVQSCTDFEPKRTERFRNRVGTADRSDGAVEGGEESVAGGVDFSPAEATEVSTDERVVLLHECAPAGVAKLGK